VDTRRFRFVIALLTLALAGVVLITLVLVEEGDSPAYPAPLEAVFPLPGDAVVRQTVIQVDLPIGYDIELEVDGIWVPPEEIGVIEATGFYTWQPLPGGTVGLWDPGEHTITVRWDRVEGGRPDPGEFTWTFRVF